MRRGTKGIDGASVIRMNGVENAAETNVESTSSYQSIRTGTSEDVGKVWSVPCMIDV